MPNLPLLAPCFGDANLYLAFFLWAGCSGNFRPDGHQVRCYFL
jgi:hypothetical protein